MTFQVHIIRERQWHAARKPFEGVLTAFGVVLITRQIITVTFRSHSSRLFYRCFAHVSSLSSFLFYDNQPRLVLLFIQGIFRRT